MSNFIANLFDEASSSPVAMSPDDYKEIFENFSESVQTSLNSLIKQSNLIIACIDAPTDNYPAYILKLQRARAMDEQTSDTIISDNKDVVKAQSKSSDIAKQTAGAIIFDNKDTVKVQLVFADESAVDGKVLPNGDTYTIIELELPDTQPLAWKKSNVTGRKWSTLDEILHRPEAKQYPLQRQQWDLFHDDRRKALVRDFSKLISDGQETHIESHGEFSLYAFTNTRPERCWTVGGEGSARLGFTKGQMSSLGGCMYTLEEADVLCFTEAEHAAWAKHNVANKPIKIIDEGFNNRRPAQSMEGFIKMIERKSSANDILIDVQKLNMPLDEYAGVQMHMQEAIKLIKSGLNGKPVSNENAPINLLNIHNAKRGNWPEGMAKEYTMLDDLVNTCQAKLYEDMNDMQGQYSIGKSNMAVKHHSDITNCGQFNLLALPGAVSQWHQDANGVYTYALAEKRTDDPNEAPDAVVKYWPSFPMYHLASEDQKVALAQYAKHGTNWRPKPAGGIPLIALVPGMFMIQQPGNIHAPITLTACFMAGGMAWKENGFRESLKVMRFLAENKDCTNEEVPRQVQEILSLLANEIDADPTKYGFASNSHEDLVEFYESLKIIHSAVPDAYCHCRGHCVKDKCQCMMLNLRCGTRCHPNKVFDHRKPCGSWKDEVASAPRKELISKNNRKAREDLFEDSGHEIIPIKSNGKRSRSLADCSGAEARRQDREDSQSSAPEMKRKKMSAREMEREGKPCHKCGRSGIRTLSRGPTGNTLCSACNKKWMKLERPAATDWLPYEFLPTTAADASSAPTASAAPHPSTTPAASPAPVTASGPRRQTSESPGSFISSRSAPPSVLSPHTSYSIRNTLNNPFRQKGMSRSGQGIVSPIAALTSSMAPLMKEATRKPIEAPALPASSNRWTKSQKEDRKNQGEGRDPTATKKVVQDPAEVPTVLTSSIRSSESQKKDTRNSGEVRAPTATKKVVKGPTEAPTSSIRSTESTKKDTKNQGEGATLTTLQLPSANKKKGAIGKQVQAPTILTWKTAPMRFHMQTVTKLDESQDGHTIVVERPPLSHTPARKKYQNMPVHHCGVCHATEAGNLGWKFKEVGTMFKGLGKSVCTPCFQNTREWCLEELARPAHGQVPAPVAFAPLLTSTTSGEETVVPGMHRRKRSDDSDEVYVSQSSKSTKTNDAFAKVAALAKKKARPDATQKGKDEEWDSEYSVDEGEWEKRYSKKKNKEKEDKQFAEKSKKETLKVPSSGSFAPRVPSSAAPVLSSPVPVLSPTARVPPSAPRVPSQAPQPEKKPKITLKLGLKAKTALAKEPAEDDEDGDVRLEENISVMNEDGGGDAEMREGHPRASVKKTRAKGAAEKAKTTRPAADNKSRVTKPKARSPTMSTVVEPVRNARHHDNIADLVELDQWAKKGAAVAKRAPEGNMISDAIVKSGKRVDLKQEQKRRRLGEMSHLISLE